MYVPCAIGLKCEYDYVMVLNVNKTLTKTLTRPLSVGITLSTSFLWMVATIFTNKNS